MGANPQPCLMPCPASTEPCALGVLKMYVAFSCRYKISWIVEAGIRKCSRHCCRHRQGMLSKALRRSSESVTPPETIWAVLPALRSRVVTVAFWRRSRISLQWPKALSIASQVCRPSRYANCGMRVAAFETMGRISSATSFARTLAIGESSEIGLSESAEVAGLDGFGMSATCISCQALGRKSSSRSQAATRVCWNTCVAR